VSPTIALNHVIEPTPTVIIFPSDHPGQRGEEAEVGENMLILPLGRSEAAAGGGWENDCDLKEYWRYSGGRWSGICPTVGLHV
jgi:hypothetical protein